MGIRFLDSDRLHLYHVRIGGLFWMIQQTTLRRRKEHEMLQSIKDLEQRGFKVIFGPVEVTSVGKTFTRDRNHYNRAKYQQTHHNASWIAKLVRTI